MVQKSRGSRLLMRPTCVSNRKGQGAIEFMIILGVAMLFFVIFFGIIQSTKGDKQRERRELLLTNVAITLRDEVGIAAGASEGYYREFDVPEKIQGINYTVSMTPGGLVYLEAENFAISYKASNVSGDFVKGTNTIKKENGTIYLNE